MLIFRQIDDLTSNLLHLHQALAGGRRQGDEKEREAIPELSDHASYLQQSPPQHQAAATTQHTQDSRVPRISLTGPTWQLKPSDNQWKACQKVGSSP
jgi:hypothetical protein